MIHTVNDYIALVGHISLNISFTLYLVVSIPQLIHNQKEKNISQLSLVLHCLFVSSYSFDLLYGFASHLNWQYKTVSTVGLLFGAVQHLQLSAFFIKKRLGLHLSLSVFFFILTAFVLYYFFIMQQGILDDHNKLYSGAIARICGLIYCIPQIIKNNRFKLATAISLHSIYLNLILAFLDIISSWCLNWGWPNKLAGPINMLLMFVMLSQTKKYRPHFPIYNSKGIHI